MTSALFQQRAMPVPRLGRGQAAAGIDLWQAAKLGEINWDDERTEPGQAG